MPDGHRLFGDGLGPHFPAAGEQGPAADAPVVMIEARSVFRRRRFHRAKAHLPLSAMRHRTAEPGDRVRYVRAETYAEALLQTVGAAPVTVPPRRGSRGPVRDRGPLPLPQVTHLRLIRRPLARSSA